MRLLPLDPPFVLPFPDGVGGVGLTELADDILHVGGGEAAPVAGQQRLGLVRQTRRVLKDGHRYLLRRLLGLRPEGFLDGAGFGPTNPGDVLGRKNHLHPIQHALEESASFSDTKEAMLADLDWSSLAAAVPPRPVSMVAAVVGWTTAAVEAAAADSIVGGRCR